jgi:hypothetical protein
MLAAGQGVLTRGSVIKDAGPNWELVDAEPEAADRLAVLGETVDTGADSTNGDQLTSAYLSGLFNRAVINLGSAALDAAGEEILRGKGIFLDVVIPASGPVPEHV